MNTNGIGLGLNISQQICEQFDGKITFDSEKDVGSTFVFQFKLEDIAEEELSEQSNKIFRLNSNQLHFKW